MIINFLIIIQEKMKKYKILKRVLFVILFLYLLLLLGKNIDYLKSKLFSSSYEKVEARITNIDMEYNRFFNLRTEVVYTYKGKQEKLQTFYKIGDAQDDKICLLFSGDKISRNQFIFDWADLQCIVLIVLIIYFIDKKCKEIHYQAAIKYAKKLHKRNLIEENDKAAE